MLNIDDYLKADGSLNLSKLTKSEDGKKFLKDAAKLYGEARASQLAYRVKHNLESLPKCKQCSKQLTIDNFIDFKRGYRTFCSNSCSSINSGPGTKNFKSVGFKEKRRKKIIDKFGTPSMICLNRDKASLTALQRYGVDHPLKSTHAKQRKIETLIKKYGVDNVWKLPEIQEKARLTLLERHGVDDPLKLVDWSRINVTKPQQEIVNFLQDLEPNLEILINDRTLIFPLELDVYVPKYNLGIEYNGLFWHSEAAGKGSKYHLDKLERVANTGNQLIHIFEDEWRDKQEIVKSRLSHHLGKSSRIFARNCKVVQVTSNNAEFFLDKCHLQGRVRSKVRLGLEHEGNLVALMTFGKPRFNRNYDWELLRYASELNCSVIGGANKLLTAFRNCNNGSIISYADRRWSQGALYHKLGFDEIGTSPPSYFYVHPNKLTRINRVSAQKHRLDGLLGDRYDSTLSEAENMKRSGFDRIFDCGNYIFSLK